MSEAMQDDEGAASYQPNPPSKSLRRILNDRKWDSFKHEIHRLYIFEYNTLQDTMRSIG